MQALNPPKNANAKSNANETTNHEIHANPQNEYENETPRPNLWSVVRHGQVSKARVTELSSKIIGTLEME